MHILLVEDNVPLLRTLVQALEASQAMVDTASGGDEADRLLALHRHDVVLLDLVGCDGDRLAWLSRLRERGDKVPVLVLTAGSGTEERVRGLDTGADDCLAQPVDLAELTAHLRALHRRTLGHAHPVLQVGRLAYDTNSRAFRIGERRMLLPPREHHLLEALITRPGHTLSKRELAARLCPLEHTLSPEALEIYVHRLRRKIAGSGAAIHTLRGLGYVLEAEAATVP